MEKKIWQNIIMKLAVITSIFYIVWRVANTIPTKFGAISLILGIIYLAIELVDLAEFLIQYIILYMPEVTLKKSETKEVPDVDILIATINEEEKLIEANIKAYLNMIYLDKEKIHIYVCDDGNRENIKRLSQKYSVGYITRNNNENAKAGNYNNALKHIHSKYIATFDADMCPKENFLEELIPILESDNNIGFVQTPQEFKNLDIYQKRFGLNIPNAQNFFYHYMQIQKNKTNSVVYCGTNAIISHKALNKIGGFATNTLTEDIATRNVNRKCRL